MTTAQSMKFSGLAKEGWRPEHLWLATILVLGAVTLTYPAWADMYRIAWMDNDCFHAVLVLPAFAWLAWIRRGRLRLCRPTGQWIGAVLIAIGWIVGTIGFHHPWQPLWHLGALLLATGALVLAVGSEILREFAAAFGVLAFLIPPPTLARQTIAIPFEIKTAHATQWLCNALGLSLERQATVLTAHGHQVVISQASNGMGMVFAMVLVCYVFAFISPLRGYARFILLAFSLFVAALGNVIRLVPTMWMYDHHPGRWADAFDNITACAMLAVGFLALLGALRILRWAKLPVTHFRLVDLA